MFFYTLSYLDVLGYCVSLLNTVRIKPPLLEQKDRIWVVDGILGQQSFNIVMYNKFSNYLRQFELSFYFFQPMNYLYPQAPISSCMCLISNCHWLKIYLFLQIPSFFEGQEDTVHYVSLEPGLGTEQGCKACEEWLFTSQSFQKVVKFLSILLYIIT